MNFDLATSIRAEQTGEVWTARVMIRPGEYAWASGESAEAAISALKQALGIAATAG